MNHRTPKCRVRVTASSRLHFGLMALGEAAERKFGGIGVMIEPPNTRLTVSAADRFEIQAPVECGDLSPCSYETSGKMQSGDESPHSTGSAIERVSQFVERWCSYYRLATPPRCRIEIEGLPQLHSGLGVGTQLGLSIAAALNAFCRLPPASAQELAASVGRGQRSAIGTHGFFEGGILAERGKLPTDLLAPLHRRAALPDDWRFVLICPSTRQGLHGAMEHQAFGAVPTVPPDVIAALNHEMDESILPAATSGDFDRFADGVYRFGYRSGLSFAAVQGGAYNGPRLTALVDRLRGMGVRGVGQSSWGPTIFALCENETSARSLVEELRDETARGTRITIASPCNHGAHIEHGTEPSMHSATPNEEGAP